MSKMIFHLLTIFPDFFRGPFEYGVVERAIRAGLIEIKIHDLRQWTHDVHRSVDDRPFGGGEGMVMKPQPIFDAVEEILPGRERGDADRWVILLSAQGAKFDQAKADQYFKEVVDKMAALVHDTIAKWDQEGIFPRK